MPQADQIPQYRLLADRFFEPDLVGKGSIIEYDGVPDEKMEPLNDAARAALDAWFEEEFPLIDEKTGQRVREHTGEFALHKPRASLRPLDQQANPPRAAGIRVLQTPKPAELNENASLAAMATTAPKEWTRPGPENIAGAKVLAAEKPNTTTPSGAPITTSTKV